MAAETLSFFDEAEPTFQAILNDAIAQQLVTSAAVAQAVGVAERTVKSWTQPRGKSPASKTMRAALDFIEARTASDTPLTDLKTPRGETATQADRLARSRAVMQAHRDQLRRSIVQPQHELPAPDLERLESAIELASRTNGAPYARQLIALDRSPRIFGCAPPDDVPAFSVSLVTNDVSPALRNQARLGNIDIRATLAGQTRVTPRRGTRRLDGSQKRTLPGLPSRITKTMLRVASLLERSGWLPIEVLTRYASPGSPAKTRHAIAKMQEHALIVSIDVRDQFRGAAGRPICLHHLTLKGFDHLVREPLSTPRTEFAQPRPVDAPRLRFLPHHVGAVSWTVALLETVAGIGPEWLTPSWSEGHLDMPLISIDGKRRPISPATAPRPDQLNVQTTVEQISDLKPDVLLWVDCTRPGDDLTRVPLMVEYDRTGEVPYNLAKLCNWEAWRVAIMRYHARFTGLGDNLGALVFVAHDRRFLLRLMHAIDQGHTTPGGDHYRPFTGNISPTGTPVAYYPGRENLFFALEEDVHYGSARVFQVPPLPPDIRAYFGQPREFRFSRTILLPALDLALTGTQGRDHVATPRTPKTER